MSTEDKEIFKGKTLSDLFKDIYNNSNQKKKQIDILINELRPLVTSINDAAIIVPLIRDYIEVGVKNDEQLVKMAAVFQKYLAAKERTNSNDDSALLTEEEKEQLLSDIATKYIEDENINGDAKEIDDKIKELANKKEKIKSDSKEE